MQERATQRHKSTSKWVKRQLRYGAGGGSADAPAAASRAAILEQLRVRDALMKKMGARPSGAAAARHIGADDGESSDGDEDDDESVGSDANEGDGGAADDGPTMEGGAPGKEEARASRRRHGRERRLGDEEENEADSDDVVEGEVDKPAEEGRPLPHRHSHTHPGDEQRRRD